MQKGSFEPWGIAMFTGQKQERLQERAPRRRALKEEKNRENGFLEAWERTRFKEGATSCDKC